MRARALAFAYRFSSGVRVSWASSTAFAALGSAGVTLLGLGLAIDYGLFMVSRFREELSKDVPIPDAVANTTATAGAVIGDHTAYHFDVPRTEGGAAGCYGSFDACQVCRHNIGIAFDDDDLFGFGHLTFGEVDAVAVPSGNAGVRSAPRPGTGSP